MVLHKKLMILILFIHVVKVSCDQPIIKVDPGCPGVMTDTPTLILYADVPAHATAKCKNGDQVFSANDRNVVKQQLDGSFDQSYTGSNCQFYKKADANTFTVEVEVGWGEDNSHVIGMRKVFTMSCAFDDHGQALSPDQSIGDGFIAPRERQGLQGSDSNAVFQLEVIDILDEVINTTVEISMGRKVRLRAQDSSDTIVAFKAISCVAENDETFFPILRAGYDGTYAIASRASARGVLLFRIGTVTKKTDRCGDGLVFPKNGGFITEGKKVYSPYFEFFKLKGTSTVRFQCSFTVCASACNGDSCTGASRKRRSYSDSDTKYKGLSSKRETVALPVVVVSSQTHTLAPNVSEPLDQTLVQFTIPVQENKNLDKPEKRRPETELLRLSADLLAAGIIMAVILLGTVIAILFLHARRNICKPERV